MSALGRVRVGHKAPDFHCEAVINGTMKDVSLHTFIRHSTQTPSLDPCASWLILLFIPAAFSFVCPTEVLAFQNCLDEFKDRNCAVVFISVDTKHSLWHWQNVPRQYGGLGSIDIPLLSDVTHRMSKDYGVLIENEGVTLRGMFIIDAEGIVQQITLNNLSVGRSVLEALRLLEAFQAVAKHGVLCPIDWKPSDSAPDTISTISNTITESYDDRLANLQKEFGSVQVTDLDAKHAPGNGDDHNSADVRKKHDRKPPGTRSFRSNSSPQPITDQDSTCKRYDNTSPTSDNKNDHETRTTSPLISIPSNSFYAIRPASAPPSAIATPTPRPSTSHPPSVTRLLSASKAHHSKTNTPIQSTPPAGAMLATAASHLAAKQNTYESRRGSHVVLEFADPISSPRASPDATPALGFSTLPRPTSLWQTTSRTTSPAPIRRTSYTRMTGWVKKSPDISKQGAAPLALPGQTRLQATFEAIKKMSAGLATPRVDDSPNRKNGGKSGGASEGVRTPGYFDVVVEGTET